MRSIFLVLVLMLTACAKKPAPQNPQVKANATGTTEAAPDTTKSSEGAADAPAPGGDPDSHTRGPVPKGGAGGAKTGGDPCEGGQ